MNTALVIIGHRTNPFDLEGSFSVHFNSSDFSSEGSNSTASAREFNLSIDTSIARTPTMRFVLVRPADGMRIEGLVECPKLQRRYISSTAKFTTPDQPEPKGRFDSLLHWDGMEGVFSATWIVPKHTSPPRERESATPDYFRAELGEAQATESHEAVT